MATTPALPRDLPAGLSQWLAAKAGECLQLLLASPSWLYLGMLTVMLFRPPDLQFYHSDRLAFVFLALIVLLRVLVLGQSLPVAGTVILPLSGLLMLSLWGALNHPYDATLWSALATRWLVPAALYCFAQFVFQDAQSIQRVETYFLFVFAYLAAIAIFSLVGMDALIFPRFVLDPGLGIHAERARGPFLQAVANGATLILLGLVALNAFRRGRLRGGVALLLLASLPLAVLATQTRAVWLSCALSLLAAPLLCPSTRLRHACLAIVLVSPLSIFFASNVAEAPGSFTDRLLEQSPVDFRQSLYEGGFQMFLERPLLGWKTDAIQPEISRRISDFHPDDFVFHNTYLDIAVAHGSLGLVLYLWLFVDLHRLGRQRKGLQASAFLDFGFRKLWPVLVAVYALNACFVVMQYQFVNAVLFTLAGMLSAQNRAAARLSWRHAQ